VKRNDPTTRTLFFCTLLVLAFWTTACAPLGKTDVVRVLHSGRDGWQHPEQVVDALDLEAGDRVAEIGAGDGYWLIWLAEAVGPEGRVYAVEVEEEKVEALHELLEDEDLANVIVVYGGYDDPKLPDGEIDLAMTVLTYHHIEGRPEYFRALQADLAEGGRVAHLDDRPDSGAPFSWFQADGHWSDPNEISSEMEQAGYRQVDSFDFLPVQSFQIYEPSLATSTAERSD
jgi:predicted methyltransferase